MNRTALALAMATIVGTSLTAGEAHALNVQTHQIMNAVAAATSPTFSSFLPGQLGLLLGVNESFSKNGATKTVSRWLGEGGLREDDGVRFFRHFHDPLKPWDTAGLSLGSLQFDSSVRWLQRNSQTQGWSWQQARSLYWTALTTADPTTRTRTWADTFRALGQVMHLVVDASVPEHVRNDPHPLEGACQELGLRCYGNYEYWVSDQQGTPGSPAEGSFISTYLSSPIGFDSTILQKATGDPQAPIPVARLIDTDTYNGTDPNVTLSPTPDAPAIGIAEFANANFFSEDAMIHSYPFPSIARLVASTSGLVAPRSGRPRSYFKKGQGDGLPVDPAAAECVLYQVANAEGVLQPLTAVCADENVWATTARAMLPRAVGYARGALDYFFRGQLEIAAPDRFLYGRTNFQEPFQTMDPSYNVNAFTRLTFKVRNATTPDEDTSCPAGQQCAPPQLLAVVQYRTGSGVDLIRYPDADLSAELSFAVSKPLSVVPTRQFQELTFDFSDSPLPANVADVFLMVVYRGPLGLETDAVMVGGKDLFEPTPVDLVNSTDYFCFNGALQHVGDLGLFPPFVLSDTSPTPPRPRDPSGDGVIDLFGPYDEFGVYAKASAPGTMPSASDIARTYDQQLGQRISAEYTRFVVLQDQPFFTMSELTNLLIDRATIPNGQASGTLAIGYQGNLNRMVAIGGLLLHQYLPSFSFRGLVTTALVFTVPQDFDSFLPCAADLFTKEPVTRIEGTLAGP
jgi:hypothetical protein